MAEQDATSVMNSIRSRVATFRAASLALSTERERTVQELNAAKQRGDAKLAAVLQAEVNRMNDLKSRSLAILSKLATLNDAIASIPGAPDQFFGAVPLIVPAAIAVLAAGTLAAIISFLADWDVQRRRINEMRTQINSGVAPDQAARNVNNATPPPSNTLAEAFGAVARPLAFSLALGLITPHLLKWIKR